jgi:hypothetical protein
MTGNLGGFAEHGPVDNDAGDLLRRRTLPRCRTLDLQQYKPTDCDCPLLVPK